MIKIPPERRAECEALRATYKPLDEPVWTMRGAEHLGDFGDYTAAVFLVPVLHGRARFYWTVGKKIVNDLLGPGRLHVGYGDEATVPLAKEAALRAVVAHRAKMAALCVGCHTLPRLGESEFCEDCIDSADREEEA